jgi:hypothetical protein
MGFRIELYPVGSMDIGHAASTILLTQTTPIIYTSSAPPLMTKSTKRRTNGDRRTYAGFTKTIRGRRECPGNEANSTRIG